jgi:cytosine/adenosine deaminase-related metal-dependent hydrolase
LRPSLSVIAALLLAPASLSAQAAILFHRVRIFDGVGIAADRDVLVQQGKIVGVGREIRPPGSAVVIDGGGKTLLPGLIDAHTHAWPGALTTALAFGVTTELEMFGDTTRARAWRAEQRAGNAADRSDIYSAGTLVTVQGGHGTEYGASIPVLHSAADAQSFVDARIAEGSDYVKIVYDDGRTYGSKWATLSPEMLRATVAAAHARRKLTLVHIGDLAGAREAIDAGADGLAHLFVDRDPDPDFGRFVGAHHAFVVPTLTVLMSITGVGGGATLVDDARIAPYLSRQEIAILKQGFPRRPSVPALRYAAAESTVKQLLAMHVPILAGTDAGNPGTAHGAALHRELELLVHAGLTPTQALASATSMPADVFKLSDRGRIAVGRRADLLLVDGDPTVDITATRNIVGVWKGGVPFDRDAVRRTISAANDEASRAPKGSESGLVSDFDEGTTATTFGAGWSISTDALAGGKSAADLAVVDSGALGSAKSLAIRGTISPVFKQAWAGAMFSPGPQPFQPANLSAKHELRFFTKGDGKTYRVFLFAESKGFTPLTQTFVAGADWTEVVIPLASFGGTDGHDVTAVIFGGGPQPGPFAFQIDHVRFQ